MEHVSVLIKEVVKVMAPRNEGKYFDGTLGGGGHAKAILDAASPFGELAGCDLDHESINRLKTAMTQYGTRCHLFQANYSEIDTVCASLGWEHIDGAVLDLGMSSIELDDAQRGFSFLSDGPLDMRYDIQQKLDAHTVVNTYDAEHLNRIIYTYGEERLSRRITKRIIEARPVLTTKELSEIVSNAIPRKLWPKKIHPATKTFQAIRMEVNSELENLKKFLPKASTLLSDGGVMAIISFHSLEDRIVKQFFAGPSPALLSRRGLPLPQETPAVNFFRITKKPIIASDDEIQANPRARSAHLRAARRIL